MPKKNLVQDNTHLKFCVILTSIQTKVSMFLISFVSCTVWPIVQITGAGFQLHLQSAYGQTPPPVESHSQVQQSGTTRMEYIQFKDMGLTPGNSSHQVPRSSRNMPHFKMHMFTCELETQKGQLQSQLTRMYSSFRNSGMS
jgi:hypothetical protein